MNPISSRLYNTNLFYILAVFSRSFREPSFLPKDGALLPTYAGTAERASTQLATAWESFYHKTYSLSLLWP
jgi:hypothetical protein